MSKTDNYRDGKISNKFLNKQPRVLFYMLAVDNRY